MIKDISYIIQRQQQSMGVPTGSGGISQQQNIVAGQHQSLQESYKLILDCHNLLSKLFLLLFQFLYLMDVLNKLSLDF